MENKILASVNGVNITENDVNAVIARYPQERRGFLNTENGKAQLLNEIVSFELMYNKGKEMNFENSPEYIAQLEAIKKELLTQVTISTLLSQVNVTDEEVKAAYEANKDAYKEPPMVNAKHILVNDETLANNIYEEINSGSISFENAALKYSTCPSKEQGGSLGNFSRGMMVPEFENAAFDMNPGDLSTPVQSQFGWHIIKVEDKTEEVNRSFEEVKNQVKNDVLQQKQNKEFTDLIKELSQKYEVKFFDK
ncbi:peptidylprolyl isomerase [Clostridium polynesiense]|uniref:peptidylprolyl isomerase n=1 Tax=Clostridium polynesiense TaxID=1325933 RepID=UPI00059121F5|nr:peptidylprolyl isomerase [Clostridium polynesiense]